MTRYKKLPALVFTVSAIAIVVFFQNCAGKGGDYAGGTSSSSGGAGTWSSSNVTITHSISSGFNTQTISFNYNDTVFQKVKGLGPQGFGCTEFATQEDNKCNDPAQMTDLSNAGWSYNTAADEWTHQFAAKTMHGRTAKMVFRRNPNDTAYFYQAITIQSIADASTNDVAFFMSLDAAGRNVIGPNVKISTAFYSHLKNGLTGSTYFCQFVKTNGDGTNNATDPCANSLPPTAPWIALPSETANDANTSMLSYYNAANMYHVTDVFNYAYKDGIKYGPFDSNFTTP